MQQSLCSHPLSPLCRCDEWLLNSVRFRSGVDTLVVEATEGVEGIVVVASGVGDGHAGVGVVQVAPVEELGLGLGLSLALVEGVDVGGLDVGDLAVHPGDVVDLGRDGLVVLADGGLGGVLGVDALLQVLNVGVEVTVLVNDARLGLGVALVQPGAVDIGLGPAVQAGVASVAGEAGVAGVGRKAGVGTVLVELSLGLGGHGGQEGSDDEELHVDVGVGVVRPDGSTINVILILGLESVWLFIVSPKCSASTVS